MLASLVLLLFSGYPVAFVLAGVGMGARVAALEADNARVVAECDEAKRRAEAAELGFLPSVSQR